MSLSLAKSYHLTKKKYCFFCPCHHIYYLLLFMAKPGKPNTCSSRSWTQDLIGVTGSQQPSKWQCLCTSQYPVMCLTCFNVRTFLLLGLFSIGRLSESAKRGVNLHIHCCIRIFLSCAKRGTFFHGPWLKSMSIWFVRSWEEVDYILPFLLQEKENCNKVCTTCVAIKEQDSQAVLETLTAHLMSTELLERKKGNQHLAARACWYVSWTFKP